MLSQNRIFQFPIFLLLRGEFFFSLRTTMSSLSRIVRAACTWPDGKAYFFHGDQYISYDAVKLCAEPGFPRTIAEGWPGVFEKDIDAAFAWPEGGALESKAFFFRADEFVRFDLSAGKVDSGYPQKIADPD